MPENNDPPDDIDPIEGLEPDTDEVTPGAYTGAGLGIRSGKPETSSQVPSVLDPDKYSDTQGRAAPKRIMLGGVVVERKPASGGDPVEGMDPHGDDERTDIKKPSGAMRPTEDTLAPSSSLPIPRTRAGFKKALLLAGGLAAILGGLAAWERFALKSDDDITSPSPVLSSAPSPSPETKEVSKPAETVKVAAPTKALATRISDTVESKSAEITDSKARARLTAKLTQAMEGELNTAASWQDLSGSWNDTPAAYKNLRAKFDRWGGFEYVTDSIDMANAGGLTDPIDTPSEMLRHIETDSNIPNGDVVALHIAQKIAGVTDPVVAAHPQQAEKSLASVTQAQIDAKVAPDGKTATPPAAPAHWEYPGTSSPSAMGLMDATDAPDPMGIITNDTLPQFSQTAPTPVFVELDHDTPAPFTSPAEMGIESIFDAPDPKNLPTKPGAFSLEEEAFFAQGAAMNEAPVPPPTKPSLVERAGSALSTLTGKLSGWGKKWFS